MRDFNPAGRFGKAGQKVARPSEVRVLPRAGECVARNEEEIVRGKEIETNAKGSKRGTMREEKSSEGHASAHWLAWSQTNPNSACTGHDTRALFPTTVTLPLPSQACSSTPHSTSNYPRRVSQSCRRRAVKCFSACLLPP